MGTTIKVRLVRSAEWVSAQQLVRGENVPEGIRVEVSPADLTLEAREILLRRGAGYQNLEDLYHHRLKNEEILFAGDAPTPDDISAAIVAAAARLAIREAELQVRDQERAAQDEAAAQKREAKKAAEAEHAARLAEARTLLADELARGEKAAEQRDLLGRLLATIPSDAKRGALRKLAAQQTSDTEEMLQKEFEDASPQWHVFAEVDDEETDEDTDDE